MEVGRIDEQERNLENSGEGVLSALLRAIDTTYYILTLWKRRY